MKKRHNNTKIEENEEINEVVIIEKKDAFNDTALIAENETNNEININDIPKGYPRINR